MPQRFSEDMLMDSM